MPAWGNHEWDEPDDLHRHFDDVMAWSRTSAYMPAWGNHEWDEPDDLRNYKGRFAIPHADDDGFNVEPEAAGRRCPEPAVWAAPIE